jgi:hypothetical protein
VETGPRSRCRHVDIGRGAPVDAAVDQTADAVGNGRRLSGWQDVHGFPSRQLGRKSGQLTDAEDLAVPGRFGFEAAGHHDRLAQTFAVQA